nr:type II/IV secretion system ATPase subunit [Candidatus Woesearchaeota archaeon]
MKLLSLFKKKEDEKTEIITEFKIDLNPQIIDLPEFQDKTKIDLKYPLLPPYTYAHIYWDHESSELVYSVEEPMLSDAEKDILKKLETGIKELINISLVGINSVEAIIGYLEKNVNVLLNELGIKISKESLIKIMYYIYRDFVGMNEIESLLKDYYIEDIECNGAKFPIYIVHRKFRNIRTNISFEDNNKLRGFVEKLAQKCGKYVSYANPLLDGVLPDGSRTNATYSEDISSRGPTFSIRKFTREPWTPIKLIEFRTASPEILAYIWILIENQSNIMVIGGTGSGKTTLLNAIAFFIQPSSRIVSIEDTREIQLMHKNWLPSVARMGFGLSNILGQKHGEVSLFDLLKESFRQRPDYVIVGEIRGEEAFVLFQGASSGHPTMATMHAESVESMVRRLETEPINLSPALIESLDAVIIIGEVKQEGSSARKIYEIDEILKVGKESIGKNRSFFRDPIKDKFYFDPNNKMFDKISKEKGIPVQNLKNEFRRRTILLLKMYQNHMFGFKEVSEVINLYYKDPKYILKKFGIE